MSETYKKKDKNTLEVTRTSEETHIVEEDRAEIQTKLDHLELDAAKSAVDFQTKIDDLKAKIAILDS
jgi:ribosome-associated translation inhibitor RaiA